MAMHASIGVPRRSDNHHPTVWGDHFLAYAHLEVTNKEQKQHEELKEEVRKMLVKSPSETLEKLELINTIQRLGIAYHFEHEIMESLDCIYKEWTSEDDGELHVVALRFRLLRQQGYHVSSDAFRKFTDDEGNYNKELVNNVQGLLSLYEAAQYRVEGEDILEEAVVFTTTHLELLLPKLSNSLAALVSNSLKYPINKAMVRVATRKYISFYQEDECRNEVLLNFAILDFNLLQKMHKRELCDLTRWWKESNLAQMLPFARDRIVELYFWSLGVYFEPQYKVGRDILTKTLCFISITDDIYDTYGTLDELTLFTNAIERWNIDASEQLPSYMKLYYHVLLDVYNGFEKELAKENKSALVKYAVAEKKKLVRAYYQEAKWYHEKIVPSMEEYVKNGIATSTYPLIASTFWLGMGEEATKEAFDWLATEPPILAASSIIGRLANDIMSHEREQKRGDVASGVECYMNEYGVTKEEAYAGVRKIIEDKWKEVNQGCLIPIVVPRVLLMPLHNLTRVTDFYYKDEDAYTVSKNDLKDFITSVLVDPINTL